MKKTACWNSNYGKCILFAVLEYFIPSNSCSHMRNHIFSILIMTRLISFRKCVDECEHSGCVGNTCFQHCRFSSDVSNEGPWYMQEPLYRQWKQWDCKSDCRYHCMLKRETEREILGQGPVKYHGKWPFKRVFGIQVCNIYIKIFGELLLSSIQMVVK